MIDATTERRNAYALYERDGDATLLIECGEYRQCGQCGHYDLASMSDVWDNDDMLCCQCYAAQTAPAAARVLPAGDGAHVHILDCHMTGIFPAGMEYRVTFRHVADDGHVSQPMTWYAIAARPMDAMREVARRCEVAPPLYQDYLPIHEY